MSGTEESLVSCIVSGMSHCRLHPGDRQAIGAIVEEAIRILKKLKGDDALDISLAEGDRMTVNGVSISLDGLEAKKLFLRLRHKDVTRIIIRREVRADEFERFCADLASVSGRFPTYTNIAVKSVREQLRVDMPHTSPGLSDETSHIRQIFRDLSVYRSINMITVDAVFGNILRKIHKGVNVLNILVPTKADAEHPYVHAAHVSMLSLLQAEHLGFGKAVLHDIGFAALTHDIGKFLLPKNILNRQDTLSEAEWALMKRHPLYGAALLASVNKVPEIALVVAYEHHLKYNGTGYPETKKKAKKQHIISQIVALADFFSVLRADLPHRQPLDKASILGLIVDASGREFNPLLVDNFVKAVESYGPG